MELQEYHVKRLFAEAGLPVARGSVAYTPAEAQKIAEKLKKGPFLIRAQMVGISSCYGEIPPIGYQEKGCFCVMTPQEVHSAATTLLCHRPDWLKGISAFFEIDKVYVTQVDPNATKLGQFIFRVNFETQCKILFVVSSNGTEGAFDLDKGLTSEIISKACRLLGKSDKKQDSALRSILQKAHHLFEKYGAVAVEVSALVRLSDGTLQVADGRLVFDPESTYKFPELVPLIESRVGKEREKLARQNGFRYMGLKGNIACVVNGIGLGWATIDLIHRKGGKVAALLDVGTEPTKEVVTKALKLLLSEPSMDAILVNIFGGVTRCDLIAEGVVAAAPEMATGLPIVVRMDGVNADLGQRVLFQSGLPLIVRTQMDEAVRSVIKAMKETG